MLTNSEAVMHFVTNGSGAETNVTHANASFAPYTSAFDRLELIDTLSSRRNGNPTVQVISVQAPVNSYPIKDDSLDLNLEAIQRDIRSLRQGRPEGVLHFVSCITFALWEQYQEKVSSPSTVVSLVSDPKEPIPFGKLVCEMASQVYFCNPQLRWFKRWIDSKVVFTSMELSSDIHAEFRASATA